MEVHKTSDIDNCGILDLPRHEDPNGNLTEVENTPAYPFAIRRVYYLYDVPANSERGGHSHFADHELLVAASGAFDVTLDDGAKRRNYRLDRPYKGLYITPGIWRTLQNFSAGSVCLVMSSDKFAEADYVREYDDFLRLTADKRSKRARYPFLDLATVNAPYNQALKEASCRVIDSGYYVGGPEVARMEQMLCDVADTPHCVGVSNGLDALRLIFRAYIEMGKMAPGDEVIVPSDTYVASILAVTDNGLKPVFVEPDLDTYNLDSTKVEAAITPLTRAMLPVHLYGRVCWDEKLADIARRHNLIVVEDNAQAIGAVSDVAGLFGTCKTGGIGHAGAFSFYPTKNIGALGDAGAVTTHDPELAAAVAALRNYGSDRQYHNIYRGLNCRLDPMQAAMIAAKLPYLAQETAHRRELACIYGERIANPKVALPADAGEGSVWHQYVVRVEDRDAFRKYLLERGVETAVHYPLPPNQQPCYAAEYGNLHLPIAEKIAREVVSLPISSCTSALDAKEISAIINTY